jgi:hypothetical protein
MGEWRKLHKEDLSDLYTLLNIVWVVITWGMWRVWCRGEFCSVYKWGGLRERAHWGAGDVDGKIILRRIFRKWVRVCGDWIYLTNGQLYVTLSQTDERCMRERLP